MKTLERTLALSSWESIGKATLCENGFVYLPGYGPLLLFTLFTRGAR